MGSGLMLSLILVAVCSGQLQLFPAAQGLACGVPALRIGPLDYTACWAMSSPALQQCSTFLNHSIHHQQQQQMGFLRCLPT